MKRTFWSLIITLFAAAFLHGKAVAQTSPTLTIAVSNFEGVPLAGAAFEITRETGESKAVESDEFGLINIVLNTPDETIEVALDDERYITPTPKRTVAGGDSYTIFRVFSEDINAMQDEERRQYGLFRGQFLAAEAEKAEAKAAENGFVPVSIRMSAFLDGTRREQERTMPTTPPTEPVDLENREIRATARLVDSRGKSVAGELVRAYTMPEDATSIVYLGVERSDSDGEVRFTNLVPGQYHRLETRLRDGRVGRSNILMYDEGETLTFRPMALRNPEEVLSGFIFVGESPASGAKIEAQIAETDLKITTMADRTGYFEIAPLDGEETTLTVSRTVGLETLTATITITPKGQELFIPLDLLAE